MKLNTGSTLPCGGRTLSCEWFRELRPAETWELCCRGISSALDCRLGEFQADSATQHSARPHGPRASRLESKPGANASVLASLVTLDVLGMHPGKEVWVPD